MITFKKIIYWTIITVSGYFLQCGQHNEKNGDWPQYRYDAGRCAYSPNHLDNDLSLNWVLKQPPPTPAWQGVHTRMPFDFAYQPVISGEKLFFAGSTDCKVYALDARTGKEQWSFYTNAPVRFSPALWKGNVYVISDDGYLYCLSADNGHLIWKKQGGKDDRMILGNNRMISRWPARGGVVIQNDILYFAAGIWPSEGIFIYALDPKTGKELWTNKDSGGLEWDQPHSTARAKSGISAQGYLTANKDHLFIPTGRAVPAALNLDDGSLEYFHLQKYRKYGGSRVFASDSLLFVTSGNTRDFQKIIGNRQAIFNSMSGLLYSQNEINSQAIAITPDYLYYVDSIDHSLKAVSRNDMFKTELFTDRKGEQTEEKVLSSPVWSVDTHQPEFVTLIAAGNKIIGGSVNNRISIWDAETKQAVWSDKVDGIPYGLAVAHNRLYVSTDKGSIYCFDSDKNKTVNVLTKSSAPFRDNDRYAQAAQDIIEKTNISSGYCLDFGCGDGRLTYELAKRTNMFIYAVDSDLNNVEKTRKLLDQTGLLGTQAMVHHCDLENTNYPDYFANLIVSGKALTNGTEYINSKELERLQRPSGGISCLGKFDEMEIKVRPALAGSGDWTHQYCDAANTITSTDEIVKGPLEMLWFYDDQMEMPSRHGRGVAPLYSDGRLFIQGTHTIRAVDAYNGTILWEYYIENLMKPYDQEHLTGTAITQGNWCLEGNRLYVRPGPSIANITGRECLVLDTETGILVDRFRIPDAPDGKTEAYWGYIAVENGILFGSIINQSHIQKWGYRESDMNQLFSESIAFFAMDAHTGKLKWMLPAKHSFRHNAIAIGNDRVYLIDRPIAQIDKIRNPHLKTTANSDQISHPMGTLLAVDAETGKLIYEKSDNIYGTLLALSTQHDILIMGYQFTRFQSPSEKRGPMTAFQASSGKKLWQADSKLEAGLNYPFSSRPILNDSTIFLEPYTYLIKTGKRLDTKFKRSYACGIISGCKNMLLYRSSTIGYLDWQEPDKGTQNVGGIRPGCWINMLPVGGIVLMPDATDRCNCSYLIKATIALKPAGQTNSGI